MPSAKPRTAPQPQAAAPVAGRAPLPWEVAGASGAHFSSCRTFRYALWRIWQPELKPTAFICLNPSTADETNDDPTVRRCINFAKAWGTGGFFMLNAFALRSTDPKALYAHPSPIGPALLRTPQQRFANENDRNVVRFAKLCSIVVAAWGAHAEQVGKRQTALAALLKAHGVVLHCLGRTKLGAPRHPLYLKSASLLDPYP